MNDELVRKLPFSLIAEQSLLGSILVDPESLNDIAEEITANDFYLTEHAQIFTAMHELFLINREIDVVTLIDTLVTKGIYNKSGGEDYIRSLYQAVPNAMNIKDYAKIVKEKSLLRKLIAACSEISDKAYSEEGSAGDLVEYAEGTVFEIAQGRHRRRLQAPAHHGNRGRIRPGHPHRFFRHRRSACRHGKFRPDSGGRPSRYGKDLVCPEHRHQRGTSDPQKRLYLLS